MSSVTRLYPWLLLFYVSFVAGAKKSTPMQNQKDYVMHVIDRLRNTTPSEHSIHFRKQHSRMPCRTPSGQEGICTPFLACARAIIKGHELYPSVCSENQDVFVCCPGRKQTSKSPSRFSFQKLLNQTSEIITSPLFSLIAVPLFSEITTRISHFRRPRVYDDPNVTQQPRVSREIVTATIGNFSRELLRVYRNYPHVHVPTRLPSANLTEKPKEHISSPKRRYYFIRKSTSTPVNLETKKYTSSANSAISSSSLGILKTTSYFTHESQVVPESPSIMNNTTLLLNNLTAMSLSLISPLQDTPLEGRNFPTSEYSQYMFPTEQPKNRRENEVSVTWKQDVSEGTTSQASPTDDSKDLVTDLFKAEELIQHAPQFDPIAVGSKASSVNHSSFISHSYLMCLTFYVSHLIFYGVIYF